MNRRFPHPRWLRPRSRQLRRGTVTVALGGTLVLLLAGCGIRATSVPVDAGSAPSRVGCVLPGEHDDSSGKPQAHPELRVFLVCGSRVSPVQRQVDIPGGASGQARVAVARTLLDQLRGEPSRQEQSAGFETDVPKDLTISGAAPGDPQETLRLNRSLNNLRAFTVAQLVCTYADSAAADANGAVTLGGPDTGERPQRFECGTALRTSPDAALTTGTQV